MLRMNTKTCSLHQLKLFQAELQSILSHVTKQNLTFEQSNIKFTNSKEIEKLKRIFDDYGNLLPLRSCISLLQLHSSQIVHNHPVFYVSINRQSNHSHRECFRFWRQLMQKKYGSKMRWFTILSGSTQAKKVKCFQFKTRIKDILKGTPHQSCFEGISQRFVKNNKNQIEWGAFVSVFRFTNSKHSKNQLSLEKRSAQGSSSIQKSNNRQIQNVSLKKNSQSNNKPYISTTSQNFGKYQKYRYHQKTKQFKNPINSRLKQRESMEARILLRSSHQINKQYENIIKKFKPQQACQGKQSQNRIRARSAKNSLLPNKQSTAQTTISDWRKSSLCSQPKKNSKFSQMYLKKMQQQRKQSNQKAIIDAVKKAIKNDKSKCQTQIIFVDQQL